MGFFYCPADTGVRLDAELFDGLKQRFGTPGHFSQAHVMAHDVAITFRT
jgi:predicted metalloprotease